MRRGSHLPLNLCVGVPPCVMGYPETFSHDDVCFVVVHGLVGLLHAVHEKPLAHRHFISINIRMPHSILAGTAAFYYESSNIYIKKRDHCMGYGTHIHNIHPDLFLRRFCWISAFSFGFLKGFQWLSETIGCFSISRRFWPSMAVYM